MSRKINWPLLAACPIERCIRNVSLGQHVAALPVSAAQAAAANSFGDLPLVVLSGDHHPAPYDDWQRDLAQLSSRGLQHLAGDCGHWIHLDRPELVTEAVRQVVAAARQILATKSSPQMVKQ
jgi:pimeloyl-ACP methyl ester carboxylesterase